MAGHWANLWALRKLAAISGQRPWSVGTFILKLQIAGQIN